MSDLQAKSTSLLDYHSTAFSAGRMDFTWEELTEEERRQAYVDWAAGKGLIAGDPRRRPGSALLPEWGCNRTFFRALALDDSSGNNGARLRAALELNLPLEVEIGFGRGDFLLDRARRHPQTLLIGYETKNKATRLMLQRTARYQIDNLWLSDDDARFNIPRIIPESRVDIFHILFPDPWWKTQHKVKRLFSPPFVDLLAAKLRSGGLLFFKSDVQEYGEMVQYLVEQHVDFLPHKPALVDRIGDFVMTHREAWCARNQRPIFTYYFARR